MTDEKAQDVPNEEQEAPKEVQEIVTRGAAIYAVVRLGGIFVEERIPRQVMQWEDEKQAWYFAAVAKRLKMALARKIAYPPRRRRVRPANG